MIEQLSQVYSADSVAEVVRLYSSMTDHENGLRSDDDVTRQNFARGMLNAIMNYRINVPKELQQRIGCSRIGELEQMANTILGKK